MMLAGAQWPGIQKKRWPDAERWGLMLADRGERNKYTMTQISPLGHMRLEDFEKKGFQ